MSEDIWYQCPECGERYENAGECGECHCKLVAWQKIHGESHQIDPAERLSSAEEAKYERYMQDDYVGSEHDFWRLHHRKIGTRIQKKE